MPLPKVNTGEKEKEFIARCMSNTVMEKEFIDDKQRLAVCHDIYDKKERNMEKSLEIRSLPTEDSEVRTIGNSRNIEGYAIIFNKESRDLGGFKEIILPGAIDGVIEKCDILALMNHNISRGVLARSIKGKGSLKIQVDSKGVKYAFEAPSFGLGNELVEGVRRGDINGSSFAFTIKRSGEKLERRNDGTYLRTIMQFDTIQDMSPCYREAYDDTTVALRSLDEFKDTESKPPAEEPVVEPIVKVDAIKRTMSDKERHLQLQNEMLKLNNK